MRPSGRAGLIGALGGVVAAIVFGLPAVSAEMPERVRKELEGFRELCVKAGGTPGVLEAAATHYDVDGDGEPDWILDSKKLSCAGAGPSYNNDTSRVFALYLRDRANFSLKLLQTVLAWEVGFARGLPALKLKRSGEDCQPRRKTPCWETYIFDRGTMRHIRTQ
jgi:hypothetical protein